MLYFQILKFSFLRFFAYPFEIIASVIDSIIGIAFFIFFWSVVAKFGNLSTSFLSLASYFLIATGIGKLIMVQWGEFGGSIGRFIKMGFMSSYLLRPYPTLIYLHGLATGKDGVGIFFAILYILTSLVIQPPTSIISIILFFLFFVIAYAISMAFNIINGTIFFHTAEASGITNSINHVIVILSGLIIPIYFFPHPWDQIVKLTPFPSMIFGPVNALKTTQLSSQVTTDLVVGVFWAIAMNIIAYLFWKESSKKYEAIGI